MLRIKETIDALRATDVQEERTEIFQEWMEANRKDIQTLYRINQKIPHTWFNVSCRFFDSDELQNIDWYKIFKEGF